MVEHPDKGGDPEKVIIYIYVYYEDLWILMTVKYNTLLHHKLNNIYIL